MEEKKKNERLVVGYYNDKGGANTKRGSQSDHCMILHDGVVSFNYASFCNCLPRWRSILCGCNPAGRIEDFRNTVRLMESVTLLTEERELIDAETLP